jgi:hypothetical protein
MLGGIADGTAQKILRKTSQDITISATPIIPKPWANVYVLSDQYDNYKK